MISGNALSIKSLIELFCVVQFRDGYNTAHKRINIYDRLGKEKNINVI